MNSFMQDVRYAARTMLKGRAFTAIALLTLTLGIGANTAVFSMINAILLRPLPYEHPEQLVKIWGKYSKSGLPQNWISEPEWWDLRASLTSFSSMAAYRTGGDANLAREASEPVHVTTTSASADLFPLLGIRAAMGRVFTAEEDQPGRNREVVLDYGFWKSKMAEDPTIIGHEVQLNGESYTVIGVLPKGFRFGGDADLWLPLALNRARPQGRGGHYLEVIARLKPEVSVAQASAETQSLARQLTAQYPAVYPERAEFGLWIRPLQTELVGNIKRGLLVVFAAVAFVLLIACLNLANLLLARSSARSREIAVRAALGAGRLRLIRQLITESILIAILGGGSGLVLALCATGVLERMAAEVLPGAIPVRMDAHVLLFALAMSVMTGVLFGLAPAVQLSTTRAYVTLKDATRGATERGGRKLRNALIIAEIAVALVLLVAAGLMVRSLQRLMQVSPGFAPEHLLTARITLPNIKYPDVASAAAFYQILGQRLQSLPGVRAAGMTMLLPMTGRHSSGSVYAENTSAQDLVLSKQFNKPYIEADQRYVSPGFFPAMRIALQRGRVFTDADDASAPPVAVVDEEFARRFWTNQDPIGQRITNGSIPKSNPPVLTWYRVVGVVGHVKNSSLEEQGREQVYFPLQQMNVVLSNPIRSMYLAIRADVEPSTLTSAVRHQVGTIDPSLALYDVKTMDEWLGQSVAQRRMNMLLLGTFGGLALLLASIGTYGVIAYSISQRTQEIGVRIALGAQPREVMAMVIGSGLRLAVAGVGIGLLLALAATQLMSTMLFGVRGTDPPTLVAVAAILVTMAVLAAFVPARRAARLDPIAALRYE